MEKTVDKGLLIKIFGFELSRDQEQIILRAAIVTFQTNLLEFVFQYAPVEIAFLKPFRALFACTFDFKGQSAKCTI